MNREAAVAPHWQDEVRAVTVAQPLPSPSNNVARCGVCSEQGWVRTFLLVTTAKTAEGGIDPESIWAQCLVVQPWSPLGKWFKKNFADSLAIFHGIQRKTPVILKVRKSRKSATFVR